MNDILIKVKNWLEEEIKNNEPVVEGGFDEVYDIICYKIDNNLLE